MIAVDTNILVYAHRRDSDWHRVAEKTVRTLASGASSWAIAWPSVHEFISVVTHPKIYGPPSTMDEAVNQVEVWMESSRLQLLSESPGYFLELKSLALQARSRGPQIHEARIAALCLHHGVDELWTADRDFSSFPALKTRNPLVS